MKTNRIQKLEEIIDNNEKRFKTEYGFEEVLYANPDLEEIKDSEDLRNFLEKLNEDNLLTEVEVTYYSKAMEFLSKNDDSLQDCLEIAAEYGYELNKLNSEILASLLASRTNEVNYKTFIKRCCKEFDEFLETYDWSAEEEEEEDEE